MIRNPHEILGVSEGASMDEIKRAYRRMAKQYHPDLHPDDPKANEKMQQINEAYDMLCNPDKYRAQQARPENPYAGWGNTGYANQNQAYQNGWRVYTYYANGDAQDNPWGAWQQADRQAGKIVNPVRGVIRVVAGILLLRFFLSILRVMFFGFFL